MNLADHMLHDLGVVDGDDHQLGVGNPGAVQYIRLGRITKVDRITLITPLHHHWQTLFDRHIAYPRSLDQGGDTLPHTTEAGDQYLRLILAGGGFQRLAFLLDFAPPMTIREGMASSGVTTMLKATTSKASW